MSAEIEKKIMTAVIDDGSGLPLTISIKTKEDFLSVVPSPWLRKLCLKPIDITDDDFSKLQYCQSLTDIEIFGCVLLTSKAMSLLPKSIKKVKLRVCPIDDQGLKLLSSSCPSLTSFSLFYCKKITDGGLKTFFESAKKLTEVSLYHPQEFSYSTFQILLYSSTVSTLEVLSWCIKLEWEDYWNQSIERWNNDRKTEAKAVLMKTLLKYPEVLVDKILEMLGTPPTRKKCVVIHKPRYQFTYQSHNDNPTRSPKKGILILCVAAIIIIVASVLLVKVINGG